MKTSDNDDLTDLLNEAKRTILELQHEIESLKSEIEQLRQQNRALATQIDSPQNQSNLKTVHDQPQIDTGGKESKPIPAPLPQSQIDGSVAMPLEPVIIVNDKKTESSLNTNRKANENLNPKFVPKNGREQMASDQTSQSDSTYVV